MCFEDASCFVSLAGWLVGVCSGWLVCAVVGRLGGWLVVSCAVAVYAGAGSGLVGEARLCINGAHLRVNGRPRTKA